jgi:hypothetical protein
MFRLLLKHTLFFHNILSTIPEWRKEEECVSNISSIISQATIRQLKSGLKKRKWGKELIKITGYTAGWPAVWVWRGLVNEMGGHALS